MKNYFLFFHNTFQNLEKEVSNLMKNGLLFAFVICLFACFLLVAYITIQNIPLLFYIGISLIKSGLFFAALFYIYGIVFDGMLKKVI